jgi:hypothetical protein
LNDGGDRFKVVAASQSDMIEVEESFERNFSLRRKMPPIMPKSCGETVILLSYQFRSAR